MPKCFKLWYPDVHLLRSCRKIIANILLQEPTCVFSSETSTLTSSFCEVQRSQRLILYWREVISQLPTWKTFTFTLFADHQCFTRGGSSIACPRKGTSTLHLALTKVKVCYALYKMMYQTEKKARKAPVFTIKSINLHCVLFKPNNAFILTHSKTFKSMLEPAL